MYSHSSLEICMVKMLFNISLGCIDLGTILYVWKCRNSKETRKANDISNIIFELSWKSCFLVLPRNINELTQRCKKKTIYPCLSLCYFSFATFFDCFYFLTALSKNKNEVLFIFDDFNIHVNYKDIDNQKRNII